ncbi:MAG: hypothetical protein WC455_26985 [Dehalococcoidia bacterium]|jgi:hypothetical protein
MLTLGSKKAELPPYTRDLFRASFSQDMATLPATLFRDNAPATITPTLSGVELLGDPGLEGTYTDGLCANMIKSGLPTVNQSADVHGGAKAQEFTAALQYNRLEFPEITLAAGAWVQNSAWAKRTAGTQGEVKFRDSVSGGFPNGITSAVYVRHIIVKRTTGANFSLQLNEYAVTNHDTVIVDDWSIQALSFPTCLGDVRTLTQSDYIVQVGCNVVAGTQIGVCFALDDAANPQNYGLAYIDGVNIHVVQCVAGVYQTESINVAQAVTPGAMVGIAKTGNSVVLTYNGTAVGTPQTLNAALCGNLKVGLFSTYAGNFFTQPFLVTRPNVIPCDIGSLVATDTYNVTELIVNGGFETLGAGDPDFFGSWIEYIEGGGAAIAIETTIVHGGIKALKLTAGSGAQAAQEHQSFTPIVGLSYNAVIWTQGDGANAGRVGWYDVTHSSWAVALQSTGVTGAVWTQITLPVTCPAGCASLRLYLQSPAVNGGIAYFDDVSVKPVSPLLSIMNGKLTCAGGKATAAWGDPHIGTNLAYARVSGRALVGTLNSNDITPDTIFGWYVARVSGSNADHGVRFGTSGGVTINYRYSTSPYSVVVGTLAAATDYTFATVLLTTGAALLVKGGAYVNWTLLYVDHVGVQTPSYAIMSDLKYAGLLDNMRVCDLPGFSDYGWCLSRVAVPAATATMGDIQGIGTTDFLVEVSPTIAAGETAGLLLCIDDPTNIQNCVKVWHDKTNLHLAKMVGGSYAADSINAAATYAAGGRIVCIKTGTTFSAYYNNVKIGADVTISDAGIVSNTKHTWTASAVTCSFSEMQLWPRYLTLLGGI